MQILNKKAPAEPKVDAPPVVAPTSEGQAPPATPKEPEKVPETPPTPPEAPKPTPEQQAIALLNQHNQEQLVAVELFATQNFATTREQMQVFGLKPIKNAKTGAVVGGSFSVYNAKNAAISLGYGNGPLTKEQRAMVAAKVQEEQMKLFKRLLGWMMARKDTLGVMKLAQRTVGKDEIEQWTIVLRDLPHAEKRAMEEYCRQQGIKVEELYDWIESKRKANEKTEKNTVNV